MEEADAWRVLRGLLQGLAYVHSQVGGLGRMWGGVGHQQRLLQGPRPAGIAG